MSQFFKSLIAAFGLIVVFDIGMQAADRAILFPYLGIGDDDSDGSYRSGMSVRRDALTGCEYLEGRYGGLTPRLGPDGRQVCRQVRS
ncbi:hypothetical protein ACFQ3K_03505 [Brucella gallinifaecis]|uniref:Uncharacterized protein n=1 Tax=Brucella gallinifaecis TaxID=215590 RepID=A0A502BQ52_9HYPH|nr:hypothetical protein [Brucella gallinifaecis]TPF75173.1 hypothetical protein FHY56_10670 [Brucella gallinifaecis]